MLTNLVEGWKGQQRTYKCCLHAAKAPIRRNKKPKPLVASGTPFQLVDGNLAFSDSALPPAKQGHPACLRRPVAQQSTFAPQGCRPTRAEAGWPRPTHLPEPKARGKERQDEPTSPCRSTARRRAGLRESRASPCAWPRPARPCSAPRPRSSCTAQRAWGKRPA